ncbi:hypothetical protein ACWKW1_03430 [Brevibacillus parabrevis]
MVATGERYDVKNDEWSRLAQMDEVRYGPGAAILPDGRVLVAGGMSKCAYLKSAEITTRRRKAGARQPI